MNTLKEIINASLSVKDIFSDAGNGNKIFKKQTDVISSNGLLQKGLLSHLKAEYNAKSA